MEIVKVRSSQIKSFGITVLRNMGRTHLEICFGKTRYLIGF